LIVERRRDMSDIQIRRRTTRLAVRSPDVDGFLPDGDVEVLYVRWKAAKWGTPIMLSGGTPSITCDMVVDVGFQALTKIYGVRRAKRLLDGANRGAI
jgi:hypothetical protein